MAVWPGLRAKPSPRLLSPFVIIPGHIISLQLLTNVKGFAFVDAFCPAHHHNLN
jgi:hypothetical protein